MRWPGRTGTTDVAGACPSCGSRGATRMGAIVEPGTDRVIGSQYGCPHCTAMYGIERGIVFRFGHLQPKPMQEEKTPLGGLASTLGRERKNPLQPDKDMPWSRR